MSKLSRSVRCSRFRPEGAFESDEGESVNVGRAVTLKRGHRTVRAFLLAMIVSLTCHGAEWGQLPALPDKEGFAGMFAGVSNGVLLAAGGANFPGKKPWEGGTKAWYDQVFMLDKPAGEWRVVGKLPRACGYGVSITTDEGVLCISGADSATHYRDCLLMSWSEGKLVFKTAPMLPIACANACGARVGNTVFVAGGLETPTSTGTLHSLWSLDLSHVDQGWQVLPAWPGDARMLSVAAACDGSFFMVSGADLHADAEGKPVRTYLRDGFRFTPGKGWTKIADLPQATVAAPSPVFGDKSFCVLGGDDGALVNFEPKTKHPGFPHAVLRYDVLTNAWTKEADLPFANVTNPAFLWHDQTVVVSGEQRPGVRTPTVWMTMPAPSSGSRGRR